MQFLSTLLFLLVVNRFVNALVARQWAQMPFCGQECVHAAPLGTCSDTDWNCLCRTDAFMLSCVACFSGHCNRTMLVDPSLRALEGQCRDNGVAVALKPLPPAPPKSSQSNTWTTLPPPKSSQSNTLTMLPPQSTLASDIPSRTPSSTSRPSAAPPVVVTPVVSSNSPTSLPATTTVTSASDKPSSISTPAVTSSTTASTTAHDSNVIGPDLNADSTGRETERSTVLIVVGVASGAAFLIIAGAIFFLVHMRRLQRRKDEASNPDALSPTRWGQSPVPFSPIINPKRRLSRGSSHPSTSHLAEQGSQLSSGNGWTDLRPGSVIPYDDRTSSSEIYVRHEDSGVVITSSSYGVVELPPEYRNLRQTS